MGFHFPHLSIIPSTILILLPLPPILATLVQDCVYRDMVNPWDIRVRGEEYIHLAMVISGDEHKIEHFTSKADRMLVTLVSLSQGRPVHVMFITEQSSVPTIARHVESALGKSLRDRILLYSEVWKHQRGYKIPLFRVEFVSLTSITSKYRSTIEHMKTHFNLYDHVFTAENKWSWLPAGKYNHDLFYLGPFYHLVFPLEKLIVTDTDIEFKYSVDLLHHQFSTFLPSHLYSLAPDLTPFYSVLLGEYRRKNPGTEVGSPGPLQGANTGMVLLHLERMRGSSQFNRFLEPEVMDRVCEKFSFKGFIGDQDWWNLVIWERPELLAPLHCSFNYQSSQQQHKTQLNMGPWKEAFPLYHVCPGEIRVLHGHDIDSNRAKG